MLGTPPGNLSCAITVRKTVPMGIVSISEIEGCVSDGFVCCDLHLPVAEELSCWDVFDCN